MPDARSVSGLSLWLPVAVYMAAIFISSSISTPAGADLVPDKVVHAAVYGGLGIVLLRALGRGLRHPISWPAMLWAILIAGLYGISDEIHQAFVSGRHADPADLLADVLGAAAAVLLTRSFARARSESVQSVPGRSPRGRGV